MSWSVIWIWPFYKQAFDGRRFEVVADGFPLFGGVQLAIETIWVSVVHPDGTARRGAAEHA